MAVRKANPAFARGDLEVLEPENKAVLAFLRTWQDVNLLAINNLSTEPQTVALDLAAYAGATPVDLFTGERLPTVTATPWSLALGPSGYRWLSLAEP